MKDQTVYCPNCHSPIIDVDHFWGLCDHCLGLDRPNNMLSDNFKSDNCSWSLQTGKDGDEADEALRSKKVINCSWGEPSDE